MRSERALAALWGYDLFPRCQSHVFGLYEVLYSRETLIMDFRQSRFNRLFNARTCFLEGENHGPFLTSRIALFIAFALLQHATWNVLT